MSRKQRALIFSAVFFTAIAIAAVSSKMEAQSRRVPPTTSTTQTTDTPAATAAGATTPGWDYRILTSPISNATSIPRPRLERRSEDSPPASRNLSYATSLEEQIRELANQGYEVQSFNVVSPACNGGVDSDKEAEVVVFLRRIKK